VNCSATIVTERTRLRGLLTICMVLTSFFKKDRFDFTVTSEVLPRVTRSFTSFSTADEEATLSRIFAGP
jgi:hypothetical protein